MAVSINRNRHFCIIIKNDLLFVLVCTKFLYKYIQVCTFLESIKFENFKLIYLNNYKIKEKYRILYYLGTKCIKYFRFFIDKGKFHTVPQWYIVPLSGIQSHLIPRGSYTFSNYLTVRNLYSSNPQRLPTLPIYMPRKEKRGRGERNHCDSVCLEIYSAIFRRRLHGRGWPILNLPINFERLVYILYTWHSEIYR